MFAATKRCVVHTDRAIYKFMPGDDIGVLGIGLINQMVEQGQAYEVRVIQLESSSKPSGEIGTGGAPKRKAKV